MAAYILPWRRTKKTVLTEEDMFQTEELLKFLRENPGFRWKIAIPEGDTPINYLEIGVFKGLTVVDMSKSYCKHPDSKMYCIDPWIDYNDYPEYKGKIEHIYNEFVKNMNKENLWDKIKVYRNFSHNVVPTLSDDFFDLVFIDGNHESEYVYKDGVMVVPKIKSGGYLIFDDYDWPETKIGINKFLEEYKSQFNLIGLCGFRSLVFLQKL